MRVIDATDEAAIDPACIAAARGLPEHIPAKLLVGGEVERQAALALMGQLHDTVQRRLVDQQRGVVVRQSGASDILDSGPP